MPLRIVQFHAIILTALALIPGGAHLFELPNKIGLAQTEYFTVQSIYRGWALFGIVLIAALIVNLLLAYMLRGQRTSALLAFAATVGIALTLVIFFTWTQPANLATAFWTQVPENWRSLRGAWEYSHAVNAGMTFLALCAT
ncbi:MAG: DUF1772 domain-containing protein, partial [Pseudorhodoplanes sp.]|nr:DUF1772 domain-containing protein [Pseudorhodoplanes sp.]